MKEQNKCIKWRGKWVLTPLYLHNHLENKQKLFSLCSIMCPHCPLNFKNWNEKCSTLTNWIWQAEQKQCYQLHYDCNSSYLLEYKHPMYNRHTTNTFSILLLYIITGYLHLDMLHINYYCYYNTRQKISIDEDQVGAPWRKHRSGKEATRDSWPQQRDLEEWVELHLYSSQIPSQSGQWQPLPLLMVYLMTPLVAQFIMLQHGKIVLVLKEFKRKCCEESITLIWNGIRTRARVWTENLSHESRDLDPSSLEGAVSFTLIRFG